MRKAPILLRREIVSYFHSPIPYAVLTLFLAISGIFFYFQFQMLAEASLRELLPSLSILLMILGPAVSMRLLAEEERAGTLEILMTDPLTEWDLVLGKFLGALAFLAIMVSVALLYGLLFEVYGDPDWTSILWSWLGLVAFGALVASIGLFASSLTRNQVVAYILAFVVVLFLFLVADFGGLAGGTLADAARFVGIQKHYESFAKGILDTRDLLYFASTTLLFLFFTVRVVESRRWK